MRGISVRRTILLAAVVIGLAAPLAPASASPASASTAGHTDLHPVSGLRVIPLRVTGSRRAHTFRVEVAATSQQQEQGLMYRTRMGADEGMIFPMKPPRLATFWMHNTVLPLDIIFIGTDGRIITIAANAVPYDDSTIPSGGVASGVLELNGGRAAQLGIRVGDRVSW
jgi:uncharacterized membrane protein (UPF0127 family)